MPLQQLGESPRVGHVTTDGGTKAPAAPLSREDALQSLQQAFETLKDLPQGARMQIAAFLDAGSVRLVAASCRQGRPGLRTRPLPAKRHAPCQPRGAALGREVPCGGVASTVLLDMVSMSDSSAPVGF